MFIVFLSHFLAKGELSLQDSTIQETGSMSETLYGN